MRGYFASPTPRWSASLFAVAGVLFVVSAWMANSDDAETSVFAYLPILIGMMALVIALAQLALWALNRAQTPPRA
jgi:drug/metabolite transporter (DMT)-like permease